MFINLKTGEKMAAATTDVVMIDQEEDLENGKPFLLYIVEVIDSNV